MEKHDLTEAELNLAEIVWGQPAITSGQLVQQCLGDFGWKKSTTYTMLKRLENKGFFLNENGIVKTIISKEEYQSRQSKSFVNAAFGGSLPKFLTAFTGGKKLDAKEIAEIQNLINQHKED